MKIHDLEGNLNEKESFKKMFILKLKKSKQEMN